MSAIVEAVSTGKDELSVCLRKEKIDRLESLWWAVNHSDDESRQAAVVTCYLDESGTHEGAPVAVVGGLLLNKRSFAALDEAWSAMLAAHSIPPPLHMKDFRRREGRLADVSNDRRFALFTDVVKIINGHKIYSIAATLTTEQFHKYFAGDFRRDGMGVYGMCFMLCAAMRHRLSEHNRYNDRIPFLMDSGNQYAEHVRQAHSAMQEEQFRAMNVGPLTFDKDDFWSPLQGADVIAWASRVRAQGDPFTNGYEPLDGIFNEAHVQEAYPEKAMAELAASLDELRQKGEFPL